MKTAREANKYTRYSKGSAEYDAAVPAQPGDGRSGGAGDGGVEQPPANRWKALIIRINAKVMRWQAQIHRYYLKLMRRHVALVIRRTFGYVRLIVFLIGVLRRLLFRRPALPYGVIHASVHDCRDALFRRRAVKKAFRRFPLQIAVHPRPGQPVIN